MSDNSAINKGNYAAWDRVKVGKDFFNLLISHPVFQREPKAINMAQFWLCEIDAAMGRNNDQPVTWFYKDIENRFQKYSQTHTEFRNALRDLGLITFTLQLRVFHKTQIRHHEHEVCMLFESLYLCCEDLAFENLLCAKNTYPVTMASR